MGITPAEDFGPRMCGVFSVGRVSAPAGVAPEALEECLLSSKGYKRRSAWLINWGDSPASFSAGLGIPFSRLRHFRAGAAARSLIWSRSTVGRERDGI